MHQVVAEFRGQLLIRRVETHLILLRDVLEQGVVIHDGVVSRPPPGVDALAQGQGLVRHDEVFVEIVEVAQPRTGRTRPERRIERERARLQFVERNAAVGAGVEFGIRLARRRIRLKTLDRQHALALAEGEFDGIRQARPVAGQDETVNHDVNRMAAFLVEFGEFINGIGLAVNAHAGEAVAPNCRERVLVPPLLPFHDGRVKNRLPLARGENRVHNLLGGLAVHFAPARRAVRHGNRPVEDSQVVVNLRHRRDDGARIAARRVLFDGNRRRKPLDLLDVGLLQPVEELPRIRRERLDVSPLPLGVERVERERRLSAAGKPRHNRQGVPRNRNVDSAEVVNASVLDRDVHLQSIRSASASWRAGTRGSTSSC